MNLSDIFKEALLEAKKEKPSAGLTKKQKSDVAKKAKAGKDIGKKGKGFEKIAKKAGGGEKGEKIAAAAMWKNVKRVKEGSDGMDHEVSMAKNSLKSIAKSVMDLMQKLGDEERDIPGWIQDHITNAENFIDQAAQGFHELGGHDEEEEEDDDEEKSQMIQPVDENKDRNSIYYNDPYRKINAKLPTQKDNTGQKMALELSKKYTPIKSDDLPLDKYLASIGKTIVDIKDLESINEKKMTKAEKEKKDEILKAMAKKGGGKEKMGPKQYAIATAQAIKSAE
jgi:hypothetical protein